MLHVSQRLKTDLHPPRRQSRLHTPSVPGERCAISIEPVSPADGQNTDIIPQIHEEIKDKREDIQPGYAMQFRLVQADIRAIKERLGMS